MTGAGRARRAAGLALATVLAASCGPSGSGSGLSSTGSGSLGFGDGVGPLCGSRAIVGTVEPRIDDAGDCGIRRPVRVMSVSGVALDPPATLECDTARTLNAWVARDVRPAFAAAGDRLEALEIAASYSCRNRNGARAGRLSEHAKGRAIDVAAFRLASGRTLTVEGDWSDPTDGPLLAAVHGSACGRFGTTLGPGSDGFHEDHLHYDVAVHDDGPYCR
jgi:hypothetical protein